MKKRKEKRKYVARPGIEPGTPDLRVRCPTDCATRPGHDTTWKYGIIKDLHGIDLRGRLRNFVSNFLSDRSFNVRIGCTLSDTFKQEQGVPQGCTLSDTFKQEQGVPQGSILSPPLFNFKINNIVKCVNDTDSSLYVDDFGIFYKSRKENPQKLTQLSSRSHPRHLVGKRTAQKDTIIDIISDSQVNSNFPNRWSPASLTFNNYFYLFLYFYYIYIFFINKKIWRI